jgi:hypothetical protein
MIHAMGDIRKGNRHSSLIIKLHKDLTEEWRKEDAEVASSQLALRLDGGAVFGGYRGGGDTPTAATLQWIDDAGKLRQEWNVARTDADTYPITALRLGPQAALIGVVRHSRKANPDGIWPHDHLLIAEMHLGQPLQTKADLEIGSNLNPSFAGLNLIGDNVLITVARQSDDKLPPGHMDEFHQFTSCGLQPFSWLILLDRSSFSQVWTKELPGVRLANAVPNSNKSVWIVGSILGECGTGTHMGLWELKSDGSFVEKYIDPSVQPSEARNLIRRRDGSVLLLGKSTRATDVDSYEERDPQRTIANSGRLWVSFSTRRTDDAELISLDSSLHEQSRAILRAGTDLWITGGLSEADHLWVYGSLGNQAALMKVVDAEASIKASSTIETVTP